MRRKVAPGPSLFDDVAPAQQNALDVAAKEAVRDVATALVAETLKLPAALDRVPWQDFAIEDGTRIRHKATRQSPLEWLGKIEAGTHGTYWRALDAGFDADTANVLLLAEDAIDLGRNLRANAVRNTMLSRIKGARSCGNEER